MASSIPQSSTTGGEEAGISVCGSTVHSGFTRKKNQQLSASTDYLALRGVHSEQEKCCLLFSRTLFSCPHPEFQLN